MKILRSYVTPSVNCTNLISRKGICYLQASSFPNGSLATLNASNPAFLNADKRLPAAGVGSLPLLEKNSLTQIDADLSVEAGLSAFNRVKGWLLFKLSLISLTEIDLLSFCVLMIVLKYDDVDTTRRRM